jgi:hypothetical protein
MLLVLLDVSMVACIFVCSCRMKAMRWWWELLPGWLQCTDLLLLLLLLLLLPTRILISEVPTVAIENVFIVNNTSIIQVGRLQPPNCCGHCQ